MSDNNISVVLAHGAWADGSSWVKVIGRLSALGVKSVAAPLPLTSLPDDVAALDRTLERVGGPVVLVGHAYAGAVIAATRSEKVKSLVYIAALAPDEGETLGGMAQGFPTPPLFSEIQQIEDGYLLLTPKGLTESFAQDLSAEEKNIMIATQAPTHASLLSTTITKAAWHTKPSWFVIASNDRAIAPEQEISTAKRMNATTLTVTSSHVAMLAQPQKVADFIIEAAASAASVKSDSLSEVAVPA